MQLTLNDLCKIYKCSKPTAVKRKQEIKQACKVKSNRITPYHISEYEGISLSKILEILFPEVKNGKSAKI